jgi:hypothetical protein
VRRDLRANSHITHANSASSLVASRCVNSLEAASKSAKAIGTLPALFMMDGATYDKGGQLGFEGIDFYFAGRGGALGDVDGSVVAAAIVFFNPETVIEAWERSRKVMPPSQSVREFVGVGAAWAEQHLADGIDYARLSELAARVIAAASPAGVPLFAAWARVPLPADVKPAALLRLNVLRELRGGLHGAAIVAHGVDPLQAVMVKTPFMAGLFGWSEPYPETASCLDAWNRADRATNDAMAKALGTLDENELDEFVALADAAHHGVV